MKRTLLLAVIAITFSACYRYSPASQPAPVVVAPASSASAAATFNGPAAVVSNTFAPTGTVTSQAGDVATIEGGRYVVWNAAKYLAVPPGTPAYLVGNVGGHLEGQRGCSGWTPGNPLQKGEWRGGSLVFDTRAMQWSARDQNTGASIPVGCIIPGSAYAVTVAALYNGRAVWSQQGAGTITFNDVVAHQLSGEPCEGGTTPGLGVAADHSVFFTKAPTVAGC